MYIVYNLYIWISQFPHNNESLLCTFVFKNNKKKKLTMNKSLKEFKISSPTYFDICKIYKAICCIYKY